MGNKISADLKYKHIANSSNEYVQLTDGLCPICYKKMKKYVYDDIIRKTICKKCFKVSDKLYRKNEIKTRDDFINNILFCKEHCFICMKKHKYLISEVFNTDLKVCYKCYKLTYNSRINNIEKNNKSKNTNVQKSSNTIESE